jgi:hypothetical protein
MPMLPFKRDFNSARINRVCNDPSVFADISLPDQESLDLSPVVADLRNIILMCDEGGIIAHWREPGVYEIHTQFTERYRGVSAVRTVREMISWLFLHSPAMELQTKVPDCNPAAQGLVKAISGRFEFERAGAWQGPQGSCGVAYYTLRWSDWLYSPWAMGGLAARGEWFHVRLEAAKRAFLSPPDSHAPDPSHDVNVGATIELIFAGQVDKSLTLYARYARFAGYAEVRLISANPLIIDIQDAVILVDIAGKDFEVLSVRPQISAPVSVAVAAVPLEEEAA